MVDRIPIPVRIPFLIPMRISTPQTLLNISADNSTDRLQW